MNDAPQPTPRERVDAVLEPELSLAEIVAQLKLCGYECEAGKLENNVAFQALERLAAHE